MKKIYFSGGILFYFGSPAGYLDKDKVVLDAMFQKEDILRYLTEKEGKEVAVQEGIYDSLAEQAAAGQLPTALDGSGSHTGERQEDSFLPRMLRIYRLKKEQPIMMRFTSLAEREKRGFGKPGIREYELAYEGSIPDFDMEKIWDIYSRKDINGHPLSISDVIALSCGGISRYFYVDRTCFQEIDFIS